MIRFGYAAQNLTLPETTNRTLRLANLGDADKVRAIIAANIAGLRRILEWNGAHGVGLFRIGQSLVPFGSHPDFPYDWRVEHRDELQAAGALARDLGIRISMHPGQYIQPASPTPHVVENSLAELRFCADLMDLLAVPDTVMVLHLGGAYAEPDVTAARFTSVMVGEERVLRYLALENDERIWSIAPVVAVAEALGVPAIVDTLHLDLNSGGVELPDAIELARQTWTRLGRRQKVHISSQDMEKQRGAHAFGIDRADWHRLAGIIGERDVDVMVEAKGKEQALIGLGLIEVAGSDPAIASEVQAQQELTLP